MDRATGPWTSPLPPAVVNPVITMYTKFEMEGNFKAQPFIAYGALFAAPTRDDQLVTSRRDYTYAVSFILNGTQKEESGLYNPSLKQMVLSMCSTLKIYA